MPKIFDEDREQKAIERYYQANKPGTWIGAFRHVMGRPDAHHTDTDVERFRKRRRKILKEDPGYFETAGAVPKSYSQRIARNLAEWKEAYEEAQAELPQAEGRLARALEAMPPRLKKLVGALAHTGMHLAGLQNAKESLGDFVNGPATGQDAVLAAEGIRDVEGAERFYLEQAEALEYSVSLIEKAEKVERLRHVVRIYSERFGEDTDVFPAGKTRQDPGKKS